jgi:hypothetical protein
MLAMCFPRCSGSDHCRSNQLNISNLICITICCRCYTRSIVLPRNERLIAQIVGLERRVGSSGRDSINHVPGGHDDIVNAVAGVAKLAHQRGFNLMEFLAAANA